MVARFVGIEAFVRFMPTAHTVSIHGFSRFVALMVSEWMWQVAVFCLKQGAAEVLP